jgi:hypothetical protein
MEGDDLAVKGLVYSMSRGGAMQRQITGFSQDEQSHWIAHLDCGHGQHVRHDPPWTVREWVTTEQGRAARIGSWMECKRCDEAIESQDSRVE